MHQVLFKIPILNAPIYGFGVMLFAAFIVCTWIAGRRARHDGVDPVHVQDLAVWIFVCGILGARITYMIQYKQPIGQFFEIWKGGLVFYGSFVGGVVGFMAAYFLVMRKHGIRLLHMADIIAPSIAIGLCLGRVGCLLNGCCYGNVATCSTCPAIHFPLSAPPRFTYTQLGYQTAAGFTLLDRRDDDPRSVVGLVEGGSAAERAGLHSGDRILSLNGEPNAILIELHGDPNDVLPSLDKLELHGAPMKSESPRIQRLAYDKLEAFRGDIGVIRDALRAAPAVIINTHDRFQEVLLVDWPKGECDLRLQVERGGEPVDLPAFRPVSLGLHPTQIYESISTLLLCLLLLAFTPLRRHTGEVMALFMVCYAVHRFLNEMLRNDTDPVFLNMTLSQNGSIVMLAGALLIYLLARKQQSEEQPTRANIAQP